MSGTRQHSSTTVSQYYLLQYTAVLLLIYCNDVGQWVTSLFDLTFAEPIR